MVKEEFTDEEVIDFSEDEFIEDDTDEDGFSYNEYEDWRKEQDGDKNE